MGPFEQTDLAGTDVAADHAERLWRALGQPARLEPDPKVAELAAAGRLGWRSGRGFYNYPRPAPEMPEAVNEVGPFMELLAHVCPIATTDGRTAAERAGDKGLALLDVAPAPFMERPSLAFTAAGLDAATKRELFKTAGHEGIALVEVPDTPGLVALRAASVLVNEAAYAAADGVADLDDIDRALQLGLSWTVGPKRLSKWFAPSISRTLAALEARDGRGRYTPAAGVG
jgi:3-hydroxybutyryl-CoA dehydrogenase